MTLVVPLKAPNLCADGKFVHKDLYEIKVNIVYIYSPWTNE